MIVTLHSLIREGRELDYDREHRVIPDDLAAEFARIGIHDWTIWRAGRHLFHRVDCDDWEAALAALAESPADARWQQHIGQIVDHFDPAGPDGSPAPLPQVWSLSDQVS
ncbi:L-rhamnose mutarotase [Desertihabitans aurantiacus]|uniref:L-rhamnose mutarotase n=1 Tax=Desertihabitans aurantiacus TaxID=2282477 RepID=UPI000DF78688|nr:L-rhamnose mutarotase [Desertihabitans aurantiacus]